MTGLSILPVQYYNTELYGGGAQGDGATDDTAAIQATINAVPTSGGDVLISGEVGATFLVSTTITVPSYVRVFGLGVGVTTILASATFTGSTVFSLSSTVFSSIRDLTIRANSSTYSSNGAFTGIALVGVADTRLENVEVDYMNGFGVLSQSTSSIGNQKIIMSNVKVHLGQQGFHILGNSGSSGVGLHELIDCNASGIGGGDGYLIEDIHDILLLNPLGECTAGTGASLHVKGNVGAVTITNCDFGPNPGPSGGAIIQISAGPNGSPKNITVLGGVIEGGLTGITVNAGSYVTLIGTRIFNNDTTGVAISDPASVHVIGCAFNQNGSVAGSGRYDLSNTSLQPVYVSHNKFDTPQGNSAGQVNACISDIGATGLGFYNGNFHNPNQGWTATNIYAGSVNPYSSTNVQGVGSVGGITPPTISGSPQSATKAFPCMVYVNGGTVSDVSIGGTSTGKTSGAFFVPAHLAIVVTYSVAPSWTWFQI